METKAQLEFITYLNYKGATLWMLVVVLPKTILLLLHTTDVLVIKDACVLVSFWMYIVEWYPWISMPK